MTGELEAAIKEATRYGVPEETMAPARETLATVTAMNKELAELVAKQSKQAWTTEMNQSYTAGQREAKQAGKQKRYGFVHATSHDLSKTHLK